MTIESIFLSETELYLEGKVSNFEYKKTTKKKTLSPLFSPNAENNF